MKFERAWKSKESLEEYKEITEDRVNRECALKHGDNAVEKLKELKTLETQYAVYRIVE